MERRAAHWVGWLALGLAPACFWEGRSGLDAAALRFLDVASDASPAPVEAGPVGACDNATDQALLGSAAVDLDAARDECGAQCFADADVARCNSDCVAAATGLSQACAGCYGADTACTMAACLPACMQPDSTACQRCRDAHCAPALEACVSGRPAPDAGAPPDSGLPADSACCADGQPLDAADAGSAPDAAADAGGADAAEPDSASPPAGACANIADQGVLASPSIDLQATLSSCGAQCFADADAAGCNSNCIAAATGLSQACAGCFGADTACTMAACLAECMQPDSAACQGCRAGACTPAFQACAFGAPIVDAGQSEDGPCCEDALAEDHGAG